MLWMSVDELSWYVQSPIVLEIQLYGNGNVLLGLILFPDLPGISWKVDIRLCWIQSGAYEFVKYLSLFDGAGLCNNM